MSRWENCIAEVKDNFEVAVSSLYIKHYFDFDTKQSVEEIMDFVREGFIKIINEADWLKAEDKHELVDKARAIESTIGFPNELLNDTLIEEMYSGLNISDNYYTNMQRIKIWSTDSSYDSFKKTLTKIDWLMQANAVTIGACYIFDSNLINIPGAKLQGIFYDKTRPTYLNFATIGQIIGHEITHGFDTLGRQFDKHGNRRNITNDETNKRFDERAQCIVEQYGNYTEPDTNMAVNGVLTLDENIADIGGLRSSFSGYNDWVRKNGEELRLPGLNNLTTRQLFWLSAANVYCDKSQLDIMKLIIKTDTHSPRRFRLNGSFSNLKEFSETFNCPPDSPMNPDKKCSVW